jgi:hypothetical protein
MEQQSLLAEFWEDRKQAGKASWENPSWWELLVLILPLAALIFLVHENLKRVEIAERQRNASAVVAMHDPPNHDRYGYRFLVNGKPFTGWAYPHDNVDYSVGEQLLVYYDPSDPSENSPDNYGEVERDFPMRVCFILIVMIVVPTQIYFRWRTYKRVRPSKKEQ